MNTETKVGIFVIVCLLLLGVTVYYVGNEQWGRHVTAYKTYLRYAGGISAGSEVLFGGIAVGRVKTVRAWDKDPTRIEILLDVKEGTPLNRKSVASLGTVSLMASPSVSITTGAQDAQRLRPGEVIASQETVSIDDMVRKLAGISDSAESLIVQVQGELKDIGAQAKVLLANLNDATGPVNRAQIAAILAQANNLLAKEAPKLDQIADQVLQVTRDADAAIGKVGPLLQHADATVENVNQTVDQLRDPIRQDLAQLNATLEQAKGLIATIHSGVRANEDDIRETVQNLRAATENLDQLSDQVKQRPWSLVRIRQPKDRKVPQ
ncbi:MAG TPA: MlaD family protein [Candidatus Acidoferrales bacterium]|nr:MlaD family protein [Candidatus Acidoferrales bacterium]HXK06483.1 MlaD family protein [Verrucomicrobiae bacterium]